MKSINCMYKYSVRWPGFRKIKIQFDFYVKLGSYLTDTKVFISTENPCCVGDKLYRRTEMIDRFML